MNHAIPKQSIKLTRNKNLLHKVGTSKYKSFVVSLTLGKTNKKYFMLPCHE